MEKVSVKNIGVWFIDQMKGKFTAAVGYDAIPQHFKDDLELEPVIRHIADDLWRGEMTKYEPEMKNQNQTHVQ